MNKKEFIKFLIKDCYSKFPEFIEKFSKEEMYKILDRNIRFVKFSSKNVIDEGLYDVTKKYIIIFKVGNSKFKSINTHDIPKDVASHEGIHALFRHNPYSTGCHYYTKKLNIKNYVKTNMLSLSGNSTILRKIKLLFRNRLYEFSEQGRGLNEGFTEWVNLRCINVSNSYVSEVNIIKQLAMFRENKDVLKIGDGNYFEIADLFNMDKTEFDVFMQQFDELYLAERAMCAYTDIIALKNHIDEGLPIDKISENTMDILTKKGFIKEGKVQQEELNLVYRNYIQPFFKSRQIAATEIQRKLLQKVILPGIKKSNESTTYRMKQILLTNILIDQFVTTCDIDKNDISELEIISNMSEEMNNKLIAQSISQSNDIDNEKDIENVQNIVYTNILIYRFMSASKIDQDKFPEFKNANDRVLKKYDELLSQSIKEKKNSSKKMDINQLRDLITPYKHLKSYDKKIRNIIEQIIGRELNEYELFSTVRDFENIIFKGNMNEVSNLGYWGKFLTDSQQHDIITSNDVFSHNLANSMPKVKQTRYKDVCEDDLPGKE